MFSLPADNAFFPYLNISDSHCALFLLLPEAKVEEFYQCQSQIMITKQTKKRQIEMDLKPLIYEMKVLNLKDLNGINVSNPELLAMGTENGIEEIPALFLKACTG